MRPIVINAARRRKFLRVGNRYRTFLWFAFGAAAMAGGLNSTNASAATWTGTASNDWADAANWSPNTVPTSSIDASISLPNVSITTPGQNTRGLNIGDALLSAGSLTITNGTSTLGNLTAAGTVNVGNLAGGTLTISGGGTFTTSSVVDVANATAAPGTITVTGTGSVWNAAGGFNIGNGGAGQLNVLAGATVSATGTSFVYIGNAATSQGAATVSGTGSSLSTFFGIIGGVTGGTGALTVSNGGNFSASAEAIVGYMGAGTFTLNTAGTANVANLAIGLVAQGTATLDDTNTKLTSTGPITIGAGFTGSLSVSTGATAQSATLVVGATAQGTLNIDGVGSAVTVTSTSSNAFSIGQNDGGAGILNITNGGQLTTQIAVAGQILSTGSTATVTISGANSTWTNNGHLVFTQQGTTGSISVLDGGTLTTNGFDAQGGATITVDGKNSSFTDTSTGTNFDLGSQPSTHFISVTNGGTLSANTYSFSTGVNSMSTITVSGTGSTFNATQGVTIANAGTANMTLSAGASAFTGNDPNSIAVTVGMGTAGSGSLTLTDAHTTWTSNGEVSIGRGGPGTLLIKKGAVLSSTFALIADGGTSTATIEDPGSLWDASAILGNVSIIGRSAAGTMNILAGGEFRASAFWIASSTPSTVTVSGAASKLTVVQDIIVGISTQGTLTVDQGASVTAGGVSGIILGSSSTGTGIINIGSGGLSGSISASEISGGFIPVPMTGGGSGTVNFNHTDDILLAVPLKGLLTINQMNTGKTTLTANNSYTGTTTISLGTLQIGNGGATGSLGNGAVANATSLIFNRGNALAVNNAISGIGSVTQAGMGTTILSGNSSYQGGTSINAGKLFVENIAGSATGSGPVITAAAATLGGGNSATNSGTASANIPGTYASGVQGIITGPVTIQAFAFLAPGGTSTGADSVGTLTLDSLTLDANAVLNYDFNSSTGLNDFIAVTAPGGLTSIGGNFNLYQEGTANAFGAPGTYHLIGYNAAVTSIVTPSIALPTDFTVLNPVAGDSYAFALNTDLDTIDLTITGSAVPEPASLSLLALAAPALIRRRRRSVGGSM